MEVNLLKVYHIVNAELEQKAGPDVVGDDPPLELLLVHQVIVLRSILVFLIIGQV